MVRDRMMLKTPELETTHQRADKEMQPQELGKINLRVQIEQQIRIQRI